MPLTLVPSVLTSTTMRRVIRPGARLMRTLPFTATVTPTNLLERINAGEVTSAPPKTVPPGVPTVNQAGQAVEPSGAPSRGFWNCSRSIPGCPWLS